VLSLGDPLSAAGEFIAKGTCAKMIENDDHLTIVAFIQSLFEADKAPLNKMENLSEWSRKALTEHLIREVLF
jgi:hypothetical protein